MSRCVVNIQIHSQRNRDFDKNSRIAICKNSWIAVYVDDLPTTVSYVKRRRANNFAFILSLIMFQKVVQSLSLYPVSIWFTASQKVIDNHDFPKISSKTIKFNERWMQVYAHSWFRNSGVRIYIISFFGGWKICKPPKESRFLKIIPEIIFVTVVLCDFVNF